MTLAQCSVQNEMDGNDVSLPALGIVQDSGFHCFSPVCLVPISFCLEQSDKGEIQHQAKQGGHCPPAYPLEGLPGTVPPARTEEAPDVRPCPRPEQSVVWKEGLQKGLRGIVLYQACSRYPIYVTRLGSVSHCVLTAAGSANTLAIT